MGYLHLLFLMHFKGFNTSGWTALAEILLFLKALQWKSPWLLLPGIFKLLRAGNLCGRLQNHVLLMRHSSWPHTLYVTADLLTVQRSFGFCGPWGECLSLCSTGLLVRLNFTDGFGNRNFTFKVFYCFIVESITHVCHSPFLPSPPNCNFSILRIPVPASPQNTKYIFYITWERKKWRFIITKDQFLRNIGVKRSVIKCNWE